MNEREELGLWGYVAMFLAILVSLALTYKDYRNPYAGKHPRDMRHPWEDQPAKYMPPQAEAAGAEYATSTSSK